MDDEIRSTRHEDKPSTPAASVAAEVISPQHLREARRYHFWRAALVGLIAGFLGVAFQYVLKYAEAVRSAAVARFHAWGPLGLLVTVVMCAGLAGLANSITQWVAPEAAGSGIPHVKGVLLGMRRLRSLRVIITKFAGGVLALAAGLSLGREGPTVHVGASAGKAVAELLKIPRRSIHTLVSAGAGAGLAVAFNAPLAGFLFVIEELRRELTPLTYGAALIASVVSDAVTRAIIGQHSAFRITGYPTPPLSALPFAALLGALAGFVGIAFTRALLFSGYQMKQVPLPSVVKGALVGAIAGLAAYYLPEVAGGGQQTAEIVLAGQQRSALIYLPGILVAKFVLTVISYSAGAPGGIFAPMLVIGAFFGLAFGEVGRDYFAAMQVSPPAFAVIGMAAVFTAVVRSPLTGVVLIVEMTSNYEQLYALIVACLAAYLVAEAMRIPPIYDALLERDLEQPDPAAKPAIEPVVTEIYVEPSSYFDGRQVRDLELPAECALVSVLRENIELVPPAHFHIEAGDVLVLLAEAEHAHVLHRAARLARAPE